MSILTVKDLSRAETLDKKALSAIQGGMMKGVPAHGYWPGYYEGPSHNSSLKAEQFIGQNQQVTNFNGNNVALAFGIESTVKPRQEANNTIIRL